MFVIARIYWMKLTIRGVNWANFWGTGYDIPLSATHVPPMLLDVPLPWVWSSLVHAPHSGIISAHKQSRSTA